LFCEEHPTIQERRHDHQGQDSTAQAQSAGAVLAGVRVAREWKTRYFKGANKIFNLSKIQPVGMMTFDPANIHGVPWELVAEAYRESIDSVEFDNLSDYAPSNRADAPLQ